jgi:hypothetical protein
VALSRASAVREDGGEASVGVVQAGYGAAKSGFRGADAVQTSGRQHRGRRYLRAVSEPRAVGEPVHARKSPCARTGRSDDHPSWLLVEAGRAGKAEAVIP